MSMPMSKGEILVRYWMLTRHKFGKQPLFWKLKKYIAYPVCEHRFSHNINIPQDDATYKIIDNSDNSIEDKTCHAMQMAANIEEICRMVTGGCLLAR